MRPQRPHSAPTLPSRGRALPRRATLALLAILVTMLAGCGGDSNAPTATPAETPLPATDVPAATTPTNPPLPSIPDPATPVSFQVVASGFTEPTLLTHAGDGSGRIFVAEKPGRIRTLDGGMFLDISDRVINTGLQGNARELGLLGLAFHPQFATNGYFYVHYNDLAGDTVISRFQVGPDGVGDPGSEKVLLTVDQPEDHFNGGTVIFGPDGYLYIALGSGGSAPEVLANSQDLGSLLGKILRIDVDSSDPYAIPPDNPYVNNPGARPEIWVYGLRNPWRISFDPATGDAYIAEPGQFAWEWVHFQSAEPNGVPPGGVNYGWPIYEGFECFEAETCEPPPDYQPPIFAYPRGQDGGCVIIGGSVYRGAALPTLQGAYFYSDFCSAVVYIAWRDAAGQWQTATLLDLDGLVSSFGTDEAGELYILDISQGLIYQMVPA